MSDFDEWYEQGDESETLIDITILARTNKATLIQHKNRQAWFPKSIAVIDEDTITYPLWCDPKWITITKRMSPIKDD